jgi:hypothetical protein
VINIRREEREMEMWERIVGRLPSNFILFSAVISVLLPLLFFKINQKLHDYGDPPWKKNKE